MRIFGPSEFCFLVPFVSAELPGPQTLYFDAYYLDTPVVDVGPDIAPQVIYFNVCSVDLLIPGAPVIGDPELGPQVLYFDVYYTQVSND